MAVPWPCPAAERLGRDAFHLPSSVTLSSQQWMSSPNLKFMGYVRSVRAVIPHMRERGEGAIVLVVGNDGVKPSYWETTAGVANAAEINFASIPVDGAERKAIMDQ